MKKSIGLVFEHFGFWGLLKALYYAFKLKIYRKLKKPHLKKRIYDYHMYLDVTDPGISRTLCLFGQREIDHKKILERVLKPGMTILDIGANIGYYALMEKRIVGETGKLIAVEPSPSNVALLKQNLKLNRVKGVQVFQGAISDTSGKREFFMANASNLNTFHNTGSGQQHLSGETIEVETHTVPDLMKDIGNPDLIRMDVEGHEVEVINGMLDKIENNEMAPMIIFETHNSRYTPEHDFVKPLRRLFKCGYVTRYLASTAESGTQKINERGYAGSQPFKSDFVDRVIYENITDDDAIDFICHVGGARTVLLAKEATA